MEERVPCAKLCMVCPKLQLLLALLHSSVQVPTQGTPESPYMVSPVCIYFHLQVGQNVTYSLWIATRQFKQGLHLRPHCRSTLLNLKEMENQCLHARSFLRCLRWRKHGIKSVPFLLKLAARPFFHQFSPVSSLRPCTHIDMAQLLRVSSSTKMGLLSRIDIRESLGESSLSSPHNRNLPILTIGS